MVIDVACVKKDLRASDVNKNFTLAAMQNLPRPLFRQLGILARSNLRLFSNTPYRSQAITSENQVPTPKKPVGGFRGGIIGFLLGFTVASGAGYIYLLDEYHAASNLLLGSVEELQQSTNKVRDYAKKIEKIEEDLKLLQSYAASEDQLLELRNEGKKIYDSLNIQHLELKAHVWSIEQDLQKFLAER
ncbi:hypothetical protein G9A89_023962 [Geosiphon pyriformis]|nr:hypothetical protein G9A89_023962 [Geosiphon pyriformis]